MAKRSEKWRRLQERGGYSPGYERGLAGARKGRRSEQRVAQVLEGLAFPWLCSSRRATEEEDHRGIDAVCELDLGTVYLQVKSSKGAAEQFLRRDVAKKLPIAVIIVSDAQPNEKLRVQVIHRLSLLREELQCGSLEEVLRRRGMLSSIDCALKEAINCYGPVTKELSRVVAGDIAVRLHAWTASTFGVPASRNLKEQTGETTVQTEGSS